jgi:hypothetical protein
MEGAMMFDKIKTVRLDEMGNEIAEWHPQSGRDDSLSLAEVVAAMDVMYPNSLIEARYVH